MKTKEKQTAAKPTGDQIVQKKLDEANAMLRKMDLSFLKEDAEKRQRNN